MLLIMSFLCSVIGALIGKQEGRNIEVMNSFELMSHTIDDKVHIDKEYYYTKEEQCKQRLIIKDRNTCAFSFIALWYNMSRQSWLPAI